jgi:hypothetical protein
LREIVAELRALRADLRQHHSLASEYDLTNSRARVSKLHRRHLRPSAGWQSRRRRAPQSA